MKIWGFYFIYRYLLFIKKTFSVIFWRLFWKRLLFSQIIFLFELSALIVKTSAIFFWVLILICPEYLFVWFVGSIFNQICSFFFVLIIHIWSYFSFSIMASVLQSFLFNIVFLALSVSDACIDLYISSKIIKTAKEGEKITVKSYAKH